LKSPSTLSLRLFLVPSIAHFPFCILLIWPYHHSRRGFIRFTISSTCKRAYIHYRFVYSYSPVFSFFYGPINFFFTVFLSPSPVTTLQVSDTSVSIGRIRVSIVLIYYFRTRVYYTR
jgi:hypothetical protein